MFYRVEQFYLSLTAKVLDEDKRFVASYLNIKEQELFFKLQVSEQRHCMNVAYDVNNHGKLGYKLLQEVGGYDQVFLERVRNHHCEGNIEDELLTILQKWDDRN